MIVVTYVVFIYSYEFGRDPKWGSLIVLLVNVIPLKISLKSF